MLPKYYVSARWQVNKDWRFYYIHMYIQHIIDISLSFKNGTFAVSAETDNVIQPWHDSYPARSVPGFLQRADFSEKHRQQRGKVQPEDDRIERKRNAR